jgi:mannose-6-phosphate isomerase
MVKKHMEGQAGTQIRSDGGAIPEFDSTGFRLEPFMRRLDKPWGWEIHWTPAHLPYVGKLIHINAGARLSLQLHDRKEESWLLLTGRAAAVWEGSDGELMQSELMAGFGYTCSRGQKHRLVGLTDCDILEVSTPEIGTTWRLEDDYSRPHETPAQRELERGSDPNGT